MRDAMTEILESLGTTKITDEEVTRAKTKLLKDRELQMADSNRIGVALSEWAAKGDWRLFFLHRDRVAAVTAADVARVAKAYLQASNRTVGFFLPTTKSERTPIPEVPDISKLVSGYTGRQTFCPHVTRYRLMTGHQRRGATS